MLLWCGCKTGIPLIETGMCMQGGGGGRGGRRRGRRTRTRRNGRRKRGGGSTGVRALWFLPCYESGPALLYNQQVEELLCLYCQAIRI